MRDQATGPNVMRVVITGSSSGIGKVLTGRLVGDGCRVWGLSRRRQGVNNLLSSAQTEGQFRSSLANVVDSSALAQVASEIEREWLGIDALITCAAIQGIIGPAMSADARQWSETVRVTLDGTFNSIVALFPLLQKSARRAKVICFSGGGASAPRPNLSAYAAAKAGVVRLVETLAVEWIGLPIDINAVAPGSLPTGMTSAVLAAGREASGGNEYDSALQTSRSGAKAFEPICGLVDYLLSDNSDGISGRLISASWDNWRDLTNHKREVMSSDIFTLRRIVPMDRGLDF